MSRAWTFQDSRQKKKLGEKKCPWSVGWIDPDGVRRSKKVGSHSLAEKFQRKKEGELAAGLCRVGPEHVAWERFRQEYEETIMVRWRSEMSRRDARHTFDLFETIAGPKYVDAVDGRLLDRYVAKRPKMASGRKKGDTVSPETIKGLSGNNFVRFMVAITLRVMIRPKNCEVVSGQALSSTFADTSAGFRPELTWTESGT